MLHLINFTQEEYLCVGKSKEQPVIAILQFLSKVRNWDINTDHIEVVSGEFVDIEDILENFKDAGYELTWQERCVLWRSKDIDKINLEIRSKKEKNKDDIDNTDEIVVYHLPKYVPAESQLENIRMGYLKTKDRLIKDLDDVKIKIEDLKQQPVDFKIRTISSERERLKVKELLKLQIEDEIKVVQSNLDKL
jgi:hypothetical protein